MGGSNEFVECFCWGAVAEGGSGAVARFVGDGVEVGLVAGDGGSFGQVAADEPVGVFVGSSLPGAVGVSEEHVHAGVVGEALVAGLVVHHLTVARIADVLAVSWNTANTAILAEGQRLLINDPTRFDGVRVIGVDEHVWRHTPYGNKFVTVILDVTPIRDRRGPSRLLDMVPGRSKQVFKTWLASRPDIWRSHIEVVAMDGFTALQS